MTIDAPSTPAFCARMVKVLRGASVLIVVSLTACQKAPTSDTLQAAAGAPSAVPATSAPTPGPSAQPTATLSYALFDGDRVVTCTDKTGPADKVAAFELSGASTKLNQSCLSLGRVPLCTCDHGHTQMHYYLVNESDKYMAACVKAGGQWITNKSPEAEIARAEQGLAAAKKAAGIKD